MERIFLESGGSDPPKVYGLAYGGGLIHLPGFPLPLVVNLQGLEIPGQVPLLVNHENRTGSRVGLISATIENGQLHINGSILSSSLVAKGVVEQMQAGGTWQLSIGAEVEKRRKIHAGQKAVVNGQEVVGPCEVVERGVLREVSVVPAGADRTTELRIAASFSFQTGEKIMDFQTWLEGKGFQHSELAGAQLATLQAAYAADTGNDPSEVNDNDKQTQNTATNSTGTDSTNGSVDNISKSSEKSEQTSAPNLQKSDAQQQGQNQAAQSTINVSQKAQQQTPQHETSDEKVQAMMTMKAEEAVAKERERIAKIQACCGGKFDKLERTAIVEGWDEAKISQECLKAVRASMPTQDFHIISGAGKQEIPGREVLEAAICLRAGLKEKSLVNDYGENVLQEAHASRQISLEQFLNQCATMEGKVMPRVFDNDSIRAAFSTVSVPGILGNVAQKRLLQSYDAQTVIATQLCNEADLNNFQEAERYRLTDVGDLEPVAPDGEIKDGGISEEKATNRLSTYGKTFTLDRQSIFNDDLGAFLRVPAGMGARAARKVDQLFFQRLLSNPDNLFSTGHKNFSSGPDSNLTGAALSKATQMFLDQTDSDGQPINLSPKFLLVPTALKITAKELLNSVTFFAVGNTDRERVPTYNAFADEDLEVVVAPYLSNSNFTNSSPKSWYLWADPQVADTFEIGYLRGKRTPTVERSDTDFDKLGIRFRVYFDIGVREQDFRGMVKFAGQ